MKLTVTRHKDAQATTHVAATMLPRASDSDRALQSPLLRELEELDSEAFAGP